MADLLDVDTLDRGRGPMDIRSRLTESASLPTLPAAAVRVLQLTGDAKSDANDLAAVIAQDPALSVKVLRAVNSPFHGLGQKVSSVPQAVALLGIKSVRTLVLGFTLAPHLESSGARGGFDHMLYWRRSMYAATAARVLAERILPDKNEDCFCAALLMDVGMLVLDQLLGRQYGQVVARARLHSELPVIETHCLGINHAEVGAELGSHWGLPDILAVPMGAHHSPMEVKDEALRKITQVVWLAGRCADVFLSETAAAESINTLRRTCKQLYKLNEEQCDALLSTIGAKTRELAGAFEVRLTMPSDYEQILSKATHRLLELSLEEKDGEGMKDKRRASRMRRDGKLTLLPCARGSLQTPRIVHLRDLSTTGLGFTDKQAMDKGSQFVVRLKQSGGEVATLLYTVCRCRAVGDIFNVGASLTSVLRPGAANSTPIDVPLRAAS